MTLVVLKYVVEKINYSDEELKVEIKRICNNQDLNKLSKELRDELISKIKTETGSSIRQISKVTGIGRGIIQEA